MKAFQVVVEKKPGFERVAELAIRKLEIEGWKTSRSATNSAYILQTRFPYRSYNEVARAVNKILTDTERTLVSIVESGK